ncbi:hypothetical protein GCM10009116_12040 [Brevundimonas basaltis]|uniref:Uncharacterized protein n=1 Tax=Brevundimonas basaltis TaxID=472166 RepID=A0A7W8MG49_9CAUL|nr:hypothetical protein [Brevundimonas basaltis]
MAVMNRWTRSFARRASSGTSLTYICASICLRSATEAPLGWADSQPQWRGSRVTSFAVTPSFGRRGGGVEDRQGPEKRGGCDDAVNADEGHNRQVGRNGHESSSGRRGYDRV